MGNVLIGTAGWSVARGLTRFPETGTALERYAAVFPAVEVNTSFYRRHRPSTWQRWHDAVPASFRFSVKLPKTITHEGALVDPDVELDIFFADVKQLGGKLACIVVQLPPKLAFNAPTAEAFLRAIRSRTGAQIFLEPRHVSWADSLASQLLERYDIGRVYADPQVPELRPILTAANPCYLRLHGSPNIYYSAYADESLGQFADILSKSTAPSWCIFDNTASGAATTDALKVLDLIEV